MTLNDDERELLRLISLAPEPVAMSSFFHTIHPLAPGLNGRHREHKIWQEKQIGLFGASVTLVEQELVRIVDPANGERPDLVEVTEQGTAALNTTA